MQVDPIAKDLIKKLLVQDRLKRLGNLKNGAGNEKLIFTKKSTKKQTSKFLYTS